MGMTGEEKRGLSCFHLLSKATLVMFCAAAFAPVAVAQENINSASVSGRVTDPSGEVVQGAQVTARQTDTNLTRSTTTDQEGRFRLPYLRVGPCEIKVQAKGFAEVTRLLTLTVGAAYELPISLAIGTTETKLTVTAEGVTLEAARSQIAGTVSQTEVKSLPLNGRNFLDLALAGSRCLSHQHRQHAALSRDFGSAGSRHLRQQSTEFFQ